MNEISKSWMVEVTVFVCSALWIFLLKWQWMADIGRYGIALVLALYFANATWLHCSLRRGVRFNFMARMFALWPAVLLTFTAWSLQISAVPHDIFGREAPMQLKFAEVLFPALVTTITTAMLLLPLVPFFGKYLSLAIPIIAAIFVKLVVGLPSEVDSNTSIATRVLLIEFICLLLVVPMLLHTVSKIIYGRSDGAA